MWEACSKRTLYVTRACPALRTVVLSFAAVPSPLPTSLFEKVIVLHGSGLEEKQEHRDVSCLYVGSEDDV